MIEMGLLWRVRKNDEVVEARLGYEDARGHVIVLYWNERVMSSEAFDDGPLQALESAEEHRRDMLARGWNEEPRVKLPDLES